MPKEKLRKRTQPIHIKFFKKFELCEVLYEDEDDIWRISSTLSARTHVTASVTLINQRMSPISCGKYRNTPHARLPKEEIERRKKEKEYRNKYNYKMDVNDIRFTRSLALLYKNIAQTTINPNHKRLRRYMSCENL